MLELYNMAEVTIFYLLDSILIIKKHKIISNNYWHDSFNPANVAISINYFTTYYIMHIEFSNLVAPSQSSDAIVVFIHSKESLSSTLESLDQKSNGQLRRSIDAFPGFKSKSGQIVPVVVEDKLYMIASASNKDKQPHTIRELGALLTEKLNEMGIEKASIILDTDVFASEEKCGEFAVNVAIGIKLRNYGFNKYYVNKADQHKISLKTVNVIVPEAIIAEVKTSFIDLSAAAEGNLIARDLIAEPANVLYPESFAQRCEDLSHECVFTIKVLQPAEMEKLGMGALLGVGKGSIYPPRLVIMEWCGNKESPEDVVAFIGKGVTFDTGGINLKGSDHIAEMKYDMGGAGVVTGLMYALSKRKAKINAVGVLGLVENMISATAQRPSDVVHSMSGQTIEVENTDAEGRLVLADAMWYTQENYRPKVMIDIATLTGAIRVALGDGHAGLFSNSSKLASQLSQAGKNTGELLWRLPLSDYYDKQIDSEIADMKNLGQHGRGGGSITAAQFLKRFLKGAKPEQCSWAHLDIAGVLWVKHPNKITGRGITGFGVMLLDQWARDFYEKAE